MGRTMTGGIDSEALKIPRQLVQFSPKHRKWVVPCRLLPQHLVDTGGGRMDDVII